MRINETIRLSFPAILGALILVCGGCCNFSSLQGNGSAPRLAWEAYLPGSTKAEVEQIRTVAENSDLQLIFENGAYSGYRAKVNRGFKWGIPLGPYRERSFWLADKKRKVSSLCIKMDCWGTTILPFMTGIFMAGDAEVYEYSSGKCLAYERFMRAGIIPLVAYEASVMPVAQGRTMPGCPSMMSPDSLCRISTSLDGVKQDEMGECYVWSSAFFDRPQYERLTSYYFLCGLMAFGQKNERAYMQIAWIPIPLWSMEE